MISVIIPAHDEEAVLPRCLESVTDGADPSELEVIVVCNGCSDGSARVARGHAFPVRVLETEEASKTHAWNLGDEVATAFPRLYLDADVQISWAAIQNVARALDDPHVLAAAPRIEIDTRGSSFAVKAFYRTWLQLPYFHTNMIGSGMFALSEAGRSRFGRFPDVIADDDFVRRQFAASERATVSDCHFTIFAPRDLASLVRIKTRSRLGRVQLDRAELVGVSEGGPSSARAALGLARSPSNWGALLVYGIVTAWTRVLARRRAAAGAFGGWERDDTSRRSVGVSR